MRHDLSIGKVAATKTGVFVKDFVKFFLDDLLKLDMFVVSTVWWKELLHLVEIDSKTHRKKK